MQEINPKDFTDRGWEKDLMFPPGFFYPKKTIVPHLHLTSVFNSDQKPVMAYLGCKDNKGNTQVIFSNGQWNEKIVEALTDEKIRTEANFAKQYSE